MFISDRQEGKISNRPTKGKLQRHASLVQRKVTRTLALAATIFLICIESAKSFTSTTTPVSTSVALSSETVVLSFLKSYGKLTKRRVKSSTLDVPLQMALGQPAMLDMKTTLGAFGGWYNTMDPVARPSVYNEDDVSDYTFVSPSDNWPTSIKDDHTPPARNRSRMTSERSRLGPVRILRRITGWVFRTEPVRSI